MSEQETVIWVILLVFIGIPLFFLPTILAANRDRDVLSYFTWNCVIGKNVIGWLILMVFVLTPKFEQSAEPSWWQK